MSKPGYKKTAKWMNRLADQVEGWSTHINKSNNKAKRYWKAEANRLRTEANRKLNRRRK